MKKNKFMRLASGLLVGTLLTTCAISGTFAKYTTQDDGNDSARVAKWGVELQVVGTLFGENYLKEANGNTVTSSTDDTAISVESTNLGGVITPDTLDASDSTVNITNLVAPGTKADDVFGIKLNGVPEVDYKIEASLTAQNVWLAAGTYGHMVKVDIPVTDENIMDLAAAEEENNHNSGVAGLYYSTDAKNFTKVTTTNKSDALVAGVFYTLEDGFTLADNYYPVVYSLGGADTAVENTQDDCYADTLLEISNEIMKRLNGGVAADLTGNSYSYAGTMSKIYDSNVSLSDLGLKGTEISWAWEFDRANPDCTDGPTDEDYKACVTCQADTFLGNLVATDTVNLIEVKSTDSGASFTEVANGTDYNLVTEFDLSISVTQVD